jgi:hypothetical protein
MTGINTGCRFEVEMWRFFNIKQAGLAGSSMGTLIANHCYDLNNVVNMYLQKIKNKIIMA